MNKQKTVVKSVRLKKWAVKEVEKRAKAENRNFSNMMETMLLKIVEQIEKEKVNRIKQQIN